MDGTSEFEFHVKAVHIITAEALNDFVLKESDASEIMLVTCYNEGKEQKRFVVEAELSSSKNKQ